MQENQDNKSNVFGYLTVIIVVFLIIIVKLFQTQIINGEEYTTQSNANTLRIETIKAKRGDIFDSEGRVFANNRPMASIKIDANIDDADLEKTILNLAELLGPIGYTQEKIREVIENSFNDSEIEIVSIPYDQGEGVSIISKFYERQSYLPGAKVEILPTRYYPEGITMGITLGYVGAISEDEYNANKEIYNQTDMIGKMGIEKTYETFKKEGTSLIGLKGQDGVRKIEVDNSGTKVGTKNTEKAAIAGDNVQLTVDLALQQELDRIMESRINEVKASNPKAGSGGAVIMNIRTGEILAISSKPDFNPNDFINGLNDEQVKYYFENVQNPMLNKVTNSPYPPGSTFKMITGLAALNYGGISPLQEYTCTGKYWEPPFIPCTGVHGSINMYEALQVSCNVYFQAAGEASGIDNISKIAKQFGLGVDPGLTDISEISKGFLPTKDSKAAYQKSYLEGLKEQLKQQAVDDIININKDKTLSANEKARSIEEIEAKRDSAIADAQSSYEYNKEWYKYDTFNLSIGQGLNNYTVLQLGQYVSTIANGGTRYQPYLVKSVESADKKSRYDAKPVVLNKIDIPAATLAEVKSGMDLVTTPGGTAYRDFGGQGLSVAAKTGTAETGRVEDNAANDFHSVFVGYGPFADPDIAIAVVIEYGGGPGQGTATTVARDAFEAYVRIKGAKNE